MIERIFDYRRARKLADDNPAEGLGKWRLVISRDYYYLLETFQLTRTGPPLDLGMWVFEPDDDVGPTTYQMHAAMGPHCRGRRAIYSGLTAIEWMYDNTDCNEILASVPVHLRHAQRIPRAAGLEFVGVQDDIKLYRMTRDRFRNMEMSA